MLLATVILAEINIMSRVMSADLGSYGSKSNLGASSMIGDNFLLYYSNIFILF